MFSKLFPTPYSIILSTAMIASHYASYSFAAPWDPR